MKKSGKRKRTWLNVTGINECATLVKNPSHNDTSTMALKNMLIFGGR